MIRIKSNSELSSFHVVYKGSSLKEVDGQRGLSHLLEHLVCKNYEDLEPEMETYGLVCNAYTSDSEVVFFMTGLHEDIKVFAERYFLKLTSGFHATEEIIEKEKNIVLEEYLDSFNDPTSNNYLNFRRKKFGYYSPIGLAKDIKNCDLSTCKQLYDSILKTPTNIVYVSPDPYDLDVSMELKESTLSENLSYVENDKGIAIEDGPISNKSSVLLSFPVYSSKQYLGEFVSVALGYGLYSPLYKEIREKKGLCYYVSCWDDHVGKDNRLMMIETTVSKGKEEQVLSTVNEILSTPKEHLTEERFNTTVAIIKRKILKRKQSPQSSSNLSEYIEEKDTLLSNHIDNITYEDVINFITENMNPDKLEKSIF